MNDALRTKDLYSILKDSGLKDNADWVSVILFIRNLLPQLTLYSEEKKAEIQREICGQIATRDLSEERFEAILGMLEMYIMQNIGTLELEKALANEKRSASQLLREMSEIVSSMQGANERHAGRLDAFREDTVDVIKAESQRSMIVSRVRGLFQEILQEFKTEADELNARASYFEKKAKFDPLLTELFNRHALDIHLEGATQGRTPDAPPLSIMMIDVDHFKQVNDTYGHQTGDDLLRALARIISAHTTHYSGFAARYGGEELVVVMHGLNLENGAIKAEAIRSGVENYDFHARVNGKLADESLQFTISIGVAQWQEGWNAEDLINAADTALYQAKDNGRNKVCTAEGQ